MDDQTRSIIRNVKGPGMTTFYSYDPGGMRMTMDRRSELGQYWTTNTNRFYHSP